MKKLFVMLAALALVSILFAGCGEKSTEPLRLCVDLEGGVRYIGGLEPAVKGFVETAADFGGPEDVEIDYIPAEGEEREQALTRIRSEIMAGAGPDVFILVLGEDNPNFTNDDPLFAFPEKSMENGVFLPLDDYIKNARYMEWDKLTQSVMNAGKTEKGQMLLPLCYTFPATIYPKDEAALSTTVETTWEDMVNDDTGFLAASGNSWRKFEYNYYILTLKSLFPAAILGEGEDYAKDQLTYSEEDLLTYTRQAVSLYRKKQNGDFDSLPEHSTVAAAVNHCCGGLEYTMVPCYQVKGGVTATVTAFAGINANTARPEDAFFLLDVLFKEDVQEKSSIYRYFGEETGIPTREGLMTEEHPASGGWYMSEENYREFSRIRDQITATRFVSVIDSELETMLADCCGTPENEPSEEEIEEIVSETYRKLKMYLSES